MKYKLLVFLILVEIIFIFFSINITSSFENIHIDERNVFLYWTGKDYKLIKILRELLYLHSNNGEGFNVILINDKNIKKYITSLPQYFYNLLPAHQADFVRVNVICDYGGIWLDSDILIMDSLDSLFDIFKFKNGFFVKENNKILCNGLFGSVPNTELMIMWKEKLLKTLDNKKNKINWSEVGADMLQNFYESDTNLYENYQIFNGLDNMYPINWDNSVDEFIVKPYVNYKNIIRDYQPLLILVNSVYKKLEDKSENEILDGNMPLNYFINKSIQNVNKSKIYKYIIIANWIENYVTNEHFMFAKQLEKFDWKIIKLDKINIDKIRDQKCIVLCITYDDFDISKLICDNVFLIYKIDDLYPFKDIRNKCINSANMIISPYQYLFNKDYVNKMYPNINTVESYWVPYSAVNENFINIEFNNNPINKIFVSGAVNKDIYPLRSFILTDKKFKEYIDILKHPGYNKNNHDIVHERYYKKLNEYICCFTDSNIYEYVLLKVFEICSTGSLLLVDDSVSNNLTELGFYDNLNCIFCNKSNLEDKIKFILNPENIHEIDILRMNGMNLVRRNHTTKNRVEYFNNLIETNLIS